MPWKSEVAGEQVNCLAVSAVEGRGGGGAGELSASKNSGSERQLCAGGALGFPLASGKSWGLLRFVG